MREQIHREAIAFGVSGWETHRMASRRTGGPSGGGNPARHRRGRGFG
jgi:hypothetical protein